MHTIQGFRGAVRGLIVVCAASAVTASSLFAQGGASSRGLLRDVPSLAASADGTRHAIRSRAAAVDVAQITAAARVRSNADVTPTVLLNLFPDATFSAVLDRVDTPASGFVWVGHVSGATQSSVTLSVEGDVMSGSIVTPQGAFTIRYTGSSHVVAQVDQASYPTELPPLIPAGAPPTRAADAAPSAVPPTSAQDDGSTIDVMVLYTPAVTASRGGDAATRTLVNLGISETNTSYANSGIAQRLRLVYAGQVAYTESSGMDTDLTNVSNVTNPAVGQSAASLRETYKADLVSLWVHYSPAPACGIAYLMTTISTSFAPNAYSVVDDECVSPNYSFAHELGHNMGARHDWFVDPDTVPRTYAHGYVYVPGRWRTIMAYNDQCVQTAGVNCTRLLAWSSPTHTFNGVPMGVPGGTSTACSFYNTTNPPCDADDARLLNETSFTTANFRQALPSALTVTGLTPSVASPSPANTTISWTASVAGGTGPYSYKFFVYDGVSWNVAQDWSTSNTWTWMPGVPATYSIQVWVRNAGSLAAYDAYGQAAYTVTAPLVLRVTSLTASPPSAAPLGTVVTWTAAATGGTGPYTYKFLVYDGVNWIVGRDWSASNIWQWSPPAPGAYSLQVWVRNAGSIALYDAWLNSGTYVVTAPPPLTVTSLISTPASSAVTNTAVVWTAFVSGGTSPYSYRFLLWNGSTWSVGRDWSASPSWTWVPAVPGTYSVQAWVRNAGSSAVYDAWRGSGSFTVTAPPPLQLTSLTADRLFPVPAGTPVRWIASASGGTGPYSFKFLISDGTSWQVGRDWSTANSWVWVPAVGGVYTVQVWARNSGSATLYDSWLGSPPVAISSATPLAVTSLTIGSNAGSAAVNTTAPVVATAVGGVGPYIYKFLVFNGTTWSVAQDWSSSSVWNWTPASTGTYSVQVWVRNSGSAAEWDAWRGAGPITISTTLLGTQGLGGGELSITDDQTLAQPFTVTSAINVNAVDLVMSGFGADQFTIWITDALGSGASMQNVRFKQDSVFPATGGGLSGKLVTTAANLHLEPGKYYLILSSAQQDYSQGWLVASSASPSVVGSVNTPILATCCAAGTSTNTAFPPASNFAAVTLPWVMSFGLR